MKTFSTRPLAASLLGGRIAGAVLVVGFLALSLGFDSVAQAQSSCDSGVTKAVARNVACQLKAYAAAQKTGEAVSEAKLIKCRTRFLDRCETMSAKGDCIAQTQACDEIALDVDAAVAMLRGATSTSTTTTTIMTTSTTTLPSCGALAGCTSCGTCGDGLCVTPASTFCKFRFDLDPVCVSGSSCTSQSCSVDADCGAGRACAQEYCCCDASGTTCVPAGENCSVFIEICQGIGLSSCQLRSFCCDPCP